MIKILFASVFALCMWAAEAPKSPSFAQLQQLGYIDPSDKSITLPADTQAVIISFEKETNTMMADFLGAKEKGFLPAHHIAYIADIHGMPSIISAMFAKPKMKKYTFPVYLYEGEAFETMFAPQKGALSVLVFDANGAAATTHTINSPEALEAFFKTLAPRP